MRHPKLAVVEDHVIIAASIEQVEDHCGWRLLESLTICIECMCDWYHTIIIMNNILTEGEKIQVRKIEKTGFSFEVLITMHSIPQKQATKPPKMEKDCPLVSRSNFLL